MSDLEKVIHIKNWSWSPLSEPNRGLGSAANFGQYIGEDRKEWVEGRAKRRKKKKEGSGIRRKMGSKVEMVKELKALGWRIHWWLTP